MSSGPQLDGAGLAKMATLEEATAALQRLHGIVERMGIAVRSQQNTAQFGMQIRRSGAPLVGLLKGQFGMIADQVTALLLIATRGGGDQAKLRSMRELVAQIRTALEIAVAKTKEKHAIEEKDAAN
ncbi:MAG TPA: hypothetical protein VL308_24765 [Gemmatimonadaceae bacterium]|jgi:hypothetical protein|nr:hypothetical protein [Gemmatimonadaceae bacterium]